jgi:hypothetical protein
MGEGSVADTRHALREERERDGERSGSHMQDNDDIQSADEDDDGEDGVDGEDGEEEEGESDDEDDEDDYEDDSEKSGSDALGGRRPDWNAMAGRDDSSVSSHGETAKSLMAYWQPHLDEQHAAEHSPIRIIEKTTGAVDLRAVAIGTVISLVVVIVIRPSFVLKEALTRFDAPTLDPFKLLVFATLVALALAYLSRKH